MQLHFHYRLLEDLSEDDLFEDEPDEDDFVSLRDEELFPLEADEPDDLEGAELL